jgi:hypothetical protein
LGYHVAATPGDRAGEIGPRRTRSRLRHVTSLLVQSRRNGCYRGMAATARVFLLRAIPHAGYMAEFILAKMPFGQADLDKRQAWAWPFCPAQAPTAFTIMKDRHPGP